LSNLYPTAFSLDGFYFRSAEGFIQGIKFPPGDPRRLQCFGLEGIRAKLLGREAEGKCIWLLDDKPVTYGSSAHRLAMKAAIRAKFDQNPELLEILLSVDGEITRDIGPEDPKTSLPKEIFCMILTNLRDQRRNQITESAI
jgi:predicted NAD-dependent protein-ADP-ribosyltransferase YbiA (DUF1768 family)